MRVERHKNFLTAEECHTLNEWVRQATEFGWMNKGFHQGGANHPNRLSTRSSGDRFEYPELALKVSNRVRQFCGVAGMPLIEGHGRDGIVVSCTFPKGDVYAHLDGPRMSPMHSILRCNVVTQAPDGGAELFIDDHSFFPEQGELHCYLVSDYVHYVTEVFGNTPRILWMFGAHVPTEEWNSGEIKVGAN